LGQLDLSLILCQQAASNELLDLLIRATSARFASEVCRILLAAFRAASTLGR
jgi:hypothetical protein